MKPMTPRKFATHKLGKSSSPSEMIRSNREMLTGYSFLSPFLSNYDSGAAEPNLILNHLQSALYAHILAEEIKKYAPSNQVVKTAINKRRGKVPPSKYTITLFVKNEMGDVEVGAVETITGYKMRNGDQNVLIETNDKVQTLMSEGWSLMEKVVVSKDAVWGAPDFGAAMRLADRKLFAREDAVYAFIANTNGRKIETRVDRGDSIARTLSRKGRPAMKKTGGRSSSLRWVGRAKQDHSNFSRG